VFNGDTRQIQYREAIQELRRSPERGSHKLEQIGAIRQVAWRDKARRFSRPIPRPWRNRTRTDMSAAFSCLCHTRRNRDRDRSHSTTAHRSRQAWSERSARTQCAAELDHGSEGRRSQFPQGQILEFHRAAKHAAKNETLEVVGIRADKIVACNARGEEREFTSKQAKCSDVYERRDIEIAPNDRLLLTANRREAGLRVTNGELVTVSGVDGQGRIQLQDGRVLPEAYRHFQHGYAVSAHRSQGKSVDAVVISGDAMKEELFYVAASRGRESVTVVTSDRELLRESVARSSARQSASELARKVPAREYQTERTLERGG
jgi:hypothetical protein